MEPILRSTHDGSIQALFRLHLGKEEKVGRAGVGELIVTRADLKGRRWINKINSTT